MKPEALRWVESGPANGLRPGGPHGQHNPSQLSASDKHRKDAGGVCEAIKSLSSLETMSLWPPNFWNIGIDSSIRPKVLEQIGLER